jgi:hypothetical protein
MTMSTCDWSILRTLFTQVVTFWTKPASNVKDASAAEPQAHRPVPLHFGGWWGHAPPTTGAFSGTPVIA